MKTWRYLVLVLAELPRLMQIGLMILAIGGGLDILYHLIPAPWLGIVEVYLGRDGYNAHLVTLAGMLITLLGLLASQLLKPRHRRAEQ